METTTKFKDGEQNRRYDNLEFSLKRLQKQIDQVLLLHTAYRNSLSPEDDVMWRWIADSLKQLGQDVIPILNAIDSPRGR